MDSSSKTLLQIPVPLSSTSSSNSLPPDTSLFLVELPPSIPLSSVTKSLCSSSLSLVGGALNQPNEQAALITETGAFYLTRVDTSNTLVLVPPKSPCHTAKKPKLSESKRLSHESTALSSTDALVCPCFYYELTPHHLDLSLLTSILHKSPYEGYADETAAKASARKTKADLCVTLQCTDGDLEEALVKVDAFTMPDGTVTVVSEELLAEVFEEILLLISSNDLDLDDISIEKHIITNVTGDVSLEKDVVRHVLRINSQDRSGKSPNVKIDVARIATFKAQKLLAAANGPVPLEYFMSKWTQQMPHQCTGVTLEESLLESLCIRTFDKKINDTTLTYFPAFKLPMDKAMRFRKLFSAKEEWPLEEIKPFVRAALKKDETVEELLLKYAVVLVEKEGSTCKAKPSML